MKVEEKAFGSIDGKTVKSCTVSTSGGLKVTTIEYGCIIQEIIVPDKDGILGNIVLGYDMLEEYQNDEAFFGAVIGRVGGRIKNAEFILADHTYNLPENDGNNHIHGGPNGFHRTHWDSSIEIGDGEARITFSYVSAD